MARRPVQRARRRSSTVASTAASDPVRPGRLGPEVRQGPEPGPGAFEDGDAARPQVGRQRLVDRRGEVREHHHRLVGVSHQSAECLRVRVVAVVLRHQVDRQRHHVHRVVVGERRQAVGEQVGLPGAGAPDVQWVRGCQAGLEDRGQARGRPLRERRERDPQPLGHVGHQHPLGPRVVHGRDALRPAADPPPDREGLQAVGELAEVVAAVHAVRREEGLPRGVGPGQGARVGVDEGPSPPRGADGERHHRDVALGRGGERRPERGRVAEGLQHQADDAGLRQRQRVGEVVGRGGDELLAGRHDEGVLQAPVGAQQRGEHGARVRHQRDRAGRHGVALEVADRPHAAGGVDEAHAAGPAELQPSRRREQLVARPVRACVDHGSAVAPRRRQPHLPGHRVPGDAEQHQVDGVRHVRQRRQARAVEHGTAPRVHQPGARDPRAPERLGRHPPAERVRSVARAHDRHRAALEHPAHARADLWADPRSCHRARPARSRRPTVRRPARASFRAARAACIPGMPQTPPPAWVAELA